MKNPSRARDGLRAKRRMRRELKTARIMIDLYCKQAHSTRKDLCDDCRTLLEYARVKLENCPFQEKKTTCAMCSVHCYRTDMRQKISTVMRYSGPRMAFRHPVLALLHMADSRRKSRR